MFTKSPWKKEDDKECEFCHKIFHFKMKGYPIRGGKYFVYNKSPKTCSRECTYKLISLKERQAGITNTCPVCKKEFNIPLAWSSKRKGGLHGTFCSFSCRWKNKRKSTKRQRTKANNRINYAIKIGLIKRQNCEMCGKKAQAHHYLGYSDEHTYDIKWLCSRHHNQEHERLRRTGQINLL